MPELTAMEKPKIAGFVDRGFNHAKKQKQMEEAEAEIARLEAEARGETVEEQPSITLTPEQLQALPTNILEELLKNLPR